MVENISKTLSPLQQRLLDGLALIPDWIPLCLIGNDKVPLGDDWTNKPYTKDEIKQAIINGANIQAKGKTYRTYPKGYGVITGRSINIGGEMFYLMALDQDGHSAKGLIQELSNDEGLPETWAFTSGRSGRCQFLLLVPAEYAPHIRTVKLKTAAKGDDGKPQEQLEFRWSNLQSVLPPSVHPETGCYRWAKSPEEIEIAPAPMWVIEAMLAEPEPVQHQPERYVTSYTAKSRSGEEWSSEEWALSYLSALSSYRADDYDDWLAVGMALHSVSDSLLTDWDNWSRQSSKYKPGDCDKKWKSFKREGVAIGTLAHMAKQDGWRSPFEKSTNFSGKTLHKNVSVTGDSHSRGDSHNVDTISIADTVTTVTEILKSGFQDWLELNKLEAVRVNSELSNKQAFYALVTGIKSQFDEVQPEDEVKLKALIDWHNAELDFHKALPSMAGDILHDAKVLNIDPIGIWQYLLAAVLSLAGKRVDLDVGSHEIPAIVWTGLIAGTGLGKTRGEKLVTAPLKQLQKAARERFKAELEEWEEEKPEEGKRKPPKPVERKYLFDVATIQAVMRRQSEQGLNGSLWARDELVGIFQSFGQFNKGENEAISCLLASWDGGSSQVDRVNQEDSYFIDASRLSIAGGIQPGVFKKIFKDPDDSQGLQARFLFAIMKPRKPKRVKGFCRLSEKLPAMYQWLDNLPEGKIQLSKDADRYYDKLYEAIGEQALNTSMPAIRAWMAKLPSQLLRIALGLHLIECYHDCDRPRWTLQKDTLERAVLFAQYYRSTFHVVQTTAANTDDISSILLQIWDKAVTQHSEGISTRDAYREIKAIQYRAKDAGRPVAAYTAELFGKLAEMGKGTVVKNGRLIKFVANLTPPPHHPHEDGEKKPEVTPPGDRVTVAETVDMYASEVSPESELSPVTVPTNVETDVLQIEVSEETEEAIPLEQTDATLADETEEAIAPAPAEIETPLPMYQRPDGGFEVAPTSTPAPQPEQLEPEVEGFSDYGVTKRPYPVEEKALERAIAIRSTYLSANTKDELTVLKQIYSQDECRWCQGWLKRYQPVAYRQWIETQQRLGLKKG